jgi:hypothetical protein
MKGDTGVGGDWVGRGAVDGLSRAKDEVWDWMHCKFTTGRPTGSLVYFTVSCFSEGWIAV